MNGSARVPQQPQPLNLQQQQQQMAQAHRPRPGDANAAIGVAVGHINSGNIDMALSILDGAIASSPETNIGALIARGTARALKRDLKGIELFAAHSLHFSTKNALALAQCHNI